MKKKQVFYRISTLLFFIVLLIGCSPQSPMTTTEPTSQKATFPERDITLVIQASPGGGSDLFARTFATAVQKHKLLPVAIIPENKPGGSGAVAYAYVNEKWGDPHFLLNVSGTFITTPLLGQGTDAGKVNYKNFTPVAALAVDEFVIAVREDSKFKTLQDIVEAAKSQPDSVNAGGTEVGSPDWICFYLIEKNTGADFNMVPFEGGDEVNAALLGGNIDVAVGNPGDFLDLYKAGKVRLLGVFAEERLGVFPEVPTLKEQGINAVYELTRGFAMPGGVSKEAVTVMMQVIQEYMETQEWKDYVTTNNLTEKFMDSDQLLAFLESSTEFHSQILKEMGVIK